MRVVSWTEECGEKPRGYWPTKNKTKIHGGNLVHCVYVCVLLGRRLFALFSFIVSFFWKRPAGGEGKDITRDQWNVSHKRASGIFHQQCMKPSLLCTPDRPSNISQQLPYFLLACIFNWFYWLVWICTNKRRGGGSKLVEIVCYGCVMMKATNDLYKLETMTVQTEIVRTGKFD